MKELLPLDDFEREIREAANGFEIKPRSSVFESIRQEINAPPVSAQAGKGTIVKTLFSKSLTFMSYAAAAAVVSVGSVFVYTQKQETPNAVLEKNRSVKTYTLKDQSTEKEADEINSTPTETYENALSNIKENTSGDEYKQSEEQANKSTLASSEEPKGEAKAATAALSTAVGSSKENAVGEPNILNNAGSDKQEVNPLTEVRQVAQAAARKTPGSRQRSPKAGRPRQLKNQVALNSQPASAPEKQDIQPPVTVKSPANELVNNTTGTLNQTAPVQANHTEITKEEMPAPLKIDSSLNTSVASNLSVAPDSSFTEKNAGDSLSNKKLKTNWVNVEGKRRLAISGFYTIENTYRTLSLPDQYDPDYWFDSYSNFRNQTDLSTQTFTAGLRLDYSLWKNLSIGTSVNYGERKESITINSYPEFEYDPFQQKAVITGYTKTAGTSIRTENLFRYIEIPLIMSYYNNIGPRFSYRVSAGVGYSMLISASSYYINFDDPNAVMGVEPEYTYTNSTSSGPFRKWNSNMYISASAGYLVNNRFEVFAGPSFKRSISSIYKDAYPVKQRFYSKGFEIGLRYFF